MVMLLVVVGYRGLLLPGVTMATGSRFGKRPAFIDRPADVS